MIQRFLMVIVFLFICRPSVFAGNDTDPNTGLNIDTGWELVSAHCGICHSHKLVISQRADRQTWLDIIRWMQATQNLWQFDPVTESTMLDYLAKNYPPQSTRRRAPIPPSLMPVPDQPATVSGHLLSTQKKP